MSALGGRRLLFLAGFLLLGKASLAAVSFSTTAALGFTNLGQRVQLVEQPAPAKLSASSLLRFFALPDDVVVAVANRLLVVVADTQVVPKLTSLPAVQGGRRLGRVAGGELLLLTVRDVRSVIALMPTLEGMPGVLSVQPDISQNITRQHSARFLDWQNFKLAEAIGLADAWRASRGEGVRVAIVDSGIDLQHPDLRGTRLLGAWDVASGTGKISPLTSNETHGTLVTGLIFARHNGIGIDGIAPEAGLIAIRQVSGWSSDVAAALLAAGEAGADVINCSWSFPWMFEPVARVVDYLAQQGRGGKGTVVVIAAGNRPRELNRLPQFAAHPAFLAVTATDHQGGRYGAAFGAGVFLAAPGMVKTTGTHFDGYEPLGATSAAAAITSGVAALMLSVAPGLKRSQVMELLAATATRQPPEDFPAGRSPWLGAGEIHAGRAVRAAVDWQRKETMQ
jgi:subtilisin family serine protease